jgi:translation initiation factor IF-2
MTKKKSRLAVDSKTNKDQLRAPIITVLGHVDHGKTTLLDAIRNTSVARKEAGGITQKIGASVVSTKKGNRITFIDTPGHAAFSKMRSRGAKVADIAILVVAANDGVKPQTIEALEYIKEARVPFIVTASKIDLPSVSVENLKKQLEKKGVQFEGSGGDVPLVSVSGKTGKGIEDLLEVILLVSEVNGIKGDRQGNLEAVVIETDKDKRGPLVSIVVRNGTLRTGDKVIAGDVTSKARGLFNDQGKPVKEIKPGEPCQVLGFSQLPEVGSKFGYQIKEPVEKKEEKRRQPQTSVEEDQIQVVIKASSAGGLEAVLEGIPLSVVVIDSGVGDVNESDVFMAKSSENAYIFTFESKVSPSVKKLADTEGVGIEKFDVIYELFDRLEELIKKGKTEITGEAEILASFPFNNKKVAGCKIISGAINKTDKIALFREGRELGKAKIVSMKKEKQNIEKAKTGEEFGIIIEPQLDFKVGDMILSGRK